MKIIIYRQYHESELCELTLKYHKITDNYSFEANENWENFCNSIEEAYPFEIIECTKHELEVLKDFLHLAYDIYDVSEVKEDEIIVMRYNDIMPYTEAAKMCHNEIKELQDKIQSLQYDMDIYDNIYYDKYASHITEEYNN